jgi:hypothetical protein
MRISLAAITAIAGLALVPAAALALEASEKVEVKGDPASVWAKIGAFCAIQDWHPAIEKCVQTTENGKPVRVLSLKGGGTIKEQQTDAGATDYTYKIIESPLPVSNYEANISVTAAKDNSHSIIEWGGTFDGKGAKDEEVVKTIDGIYKAGLDSIKAKMGS